jgi:hypothetical protein
MNLSSLTSPLIVTVLASSTAYAKLDFKKEILPLLENRCLKCHKAEHEENGKIVKPKGDQRLDAAWAMLKGFKDVIPVKPKEPAKSAIVTVTTLPKDDDKFMPPEGKGDPLTTEEINKIKTWIIEGADFGGWEGNLAGKPAEAPVVAKEPVRDRPHDVLYKKLSEGLQPPTDEVLKKVKEAGAQIGTLMPSSPLVRVDFLTGVSKCDDKSIAALAPLNQNITHLDLARTAVTDAAVKSIVQMSRLTRLDLRRTKITDAGVAQLAALKNLTYINLFGTEVTDKGLASLASMKSLQNIYLYETKVTDAGVDKLKAALPKAEIVFNVDITAAAERPQTSKKGKKTK